MSEHARAQTSSSPTDVQDPSLGGIDLKRITSSGLLDQLDSLVTEFGKRSMDLHGACRRLRTLLDGASELTSGQRNELLNRYIARFDQSFQFREEAVVRGSQTRTNPEQGLPSALPDVNNRPNDRTVEIGDQAGGLLTALRGRRQRDDDDDEARGRAKRLREVEDDHDPRYAWNWDYPGGNRPWDVDVLLTTPQKTRRLRNIYNLDPGAAVRSLLARGQPPPFPYDQWRNLVCDRHIDLAAIVKDHNPVSPQYHEAIGPWILGFQKYKRALLYAYPHRRDELDIYYAHILDKFFACTDHSRVINYDSAVRKFVQERYHLCFADIHLFNDIAFKHLNSGGSARGAYNANTDKPKGRGKLGGRSRAIPICGEFNTKKRCSFDPCKFRHVCRVCSGNHPRFQCTKKSTQKTTA